MNEIHKKVGTIAYFGLALLISLPIGTAKGGSKDESRLVKMAEDEFSLTTAEEILLRAAIIGEPADCSGKSEEDNDPNNAQEWDKETRAIKAEVLAWLCKDKEASAMVTDKGVLIKGARIDGKLDLEFARISFPLRFIRSAFPRQINLRHAEIRELELNGTRTGPINGYGLTVQGNVQLSEDCQVAGGVILFRATIGEDLDCNGSMFMDPNGCALNAGSATIGGSISLLDFEAQGEVNLTGATVGEDIISNGRLLNGPAIALNATNINIKGNSYFRGGQVEGWVILYGAKIAGTLRWTDVYSEEDMTLDLRSANIGVLYDGDKSWPDPNKLLLDGLVYREISGDAPQDLKSRLGWLSLQPVFEPQPYEQLAEFYRKTWRKNEAVEVIIAKNKDRAKLTKLTLSEKCWYLILGPMIGYGYLPMRAMWAALMAILLGWVIFEVGYQGDLITPESDSAYVKKDLVTAVECTDPQHLSNVYPSFNSLIYSIDVFVPIVDLCQAKYWLPNAHHGHELLRIRRFKLRFGSLLRLYFWVHIGMGWLLSTLFVAGLSQVVRT